MLQFRKEYAWRPVNWRWERARLLREGKLRGLPKRNEDPHVLTAAAFQKAIDKCRDDVDRYIVGEKYPGLFDAYLARRPAQDTVSGIRHWAIEARLLAGEPAESIAKKTAATAEVVEWYERLFFNVSDRLEAPDYI